jgi:signal transduction histidine kinase
LVTAVFSSVSAKNISAPFSYLKQYIRKISERKFGTKINMAVDDELQEFVNNINTMSEKLETFDKAQKSFFQNASHELRTPLMSIQSYAEGIKYNVVEHNAAAEIIIDEAKRMTSLVEDLLYLSRLDTIEENYDLEEMDFSEWISRSAKRISVIASKHGIKVSLECSWEGAKIYADDEMLSRALANVIGNCIRYARSTIKISCSITAADKVEIDIADDGPGIDASELPNIFERFYKGKKGNFGLGLAISKNIIDKHNGKITAENTEAGALFKIVLPMKCAL